MNHGETEYLVQTNYLVENFSVELEISSFFSSVLKRVKKGDVCFFTRGNDSKFYIP